MPILNGAVAYKIDTIPSLESEISQWTGAKREPNFPCPGNAGNPCAVEYRLFVHNDASAERIAEYVADAQDGLRGWCPEEHAFRITMHGGPKEGKLTRFYVFVATL